jgi:hypothetical protein
VEFHDEGKLTPKNAPVKAIFAADSVKKIAVQNAEKRLLTYDLFIL